MFALAGAAIYGVGRPRLALTYLIMAGVSIGLSAYFHDADVSSP